MKHDVISNNTKLMGEWNWEKNNALNLFPDKITCGSSKITVWWKCKTCNYEWKTTPNNRIRGTNCPACANRVVVEGFNDLQTLYPDIAKRWHKTLNKIQPTQVVPKSQRKVYWCCEKNHNHYFLTRIDHMVSDNVQCPVCVNQKVIKGVNDLETTHPELIKEWDFEKNRIFPDTIPYGTTRRVWWKCKSGHSWQASVGSRAGSQKTGCPICKKELSVSFPEKSIAFYLSKVFYIEENKRFEWLGRAELDIYIPELNLAIEYDGQAWHKDISRDCRKDLLCEKNDIKLIRIRELECPIYESGSIKYSIIAQDNNSLNKIIFEIFDYINSKYNKKINLIIDVEKDYQQIVSQMLMLLKDKSVLNSDLLKEWNYKKNGKILPETISLGSDKKIWWICDKGHEWKATVSSRSGKQKCGCPYCSGQKVISGWNDLGTLYPNIAKEWDIDKNSIKPSQVRPQSNKKYWWKCSSCNNSWETSIATRVRGRNCPKCARQITICSHFKKVICIETKEVFNSIKEASMKYNLNGTSISNCCKGKSKTAGGYHWEYIKKD